MLSPRNLLITGGTGYIGSNLIDYINDFSANFFQSITIIDRSIKKNNLKNIDLNQIQLIEFDLKNHPEQNQTLVNQLKNATILIHSSYLGDYESEKKFFEFVLQNNPNIKIIFLSSAAVYGESLESSKEIDTPKPINDYGRAKLAGEEFIIKNFKNYIIFRIANPYGKEKNIKGFYKIVVEKLKNAERKISLNADHPQQIIRDFIYIDELCKEIIELSKSSNNEIFNISSGKGVSLENFTLAIADELNISRTEIEFVYSGSRAGEIKRSTLDNFKIKSSTLMSS